MKIYCIQNVKNENLYWTNSWGWIDTSEDGFEEATFDLFSGKEVNYLNLPMEGRWKFYGEAVDLSEESEK